MKKVILSLMLLPIISNGQNNNNATTTIHAESDKQFIESLTIEPVYEYKGKSKNIVLPVSLFETSMNSPFILETQSPQYDEMKNILNGVTYDKLKGKSIIFTGVENDKYLFTIDGKNYKIIATNKATLCNHEFYNLFDEAYIEK